MFRVDEEQFLEARNQFGDKSKEQQVIDKRVQNAKVIASMLTREITLK